MKEHVIKRGSWHHRLALHGGLGPKMSVDACTYARAVIRGAFEQAFIFTLISAFFLGLLFVGALYVYGLYLLTFGGGTLLSLLEGGPHITRAQTLALTAVVLLTLAALAFAILVLICKARDLVQARRLAEDEAPVGPFRLLYRSLRDKVCYTITIK